MFFKSSQSPRTTPNILHTSESILYSLSHRILSSGTRTMGSFHWLLYTLFIISFLDTVTHAINVKPQKEKFTPDYKHYHNVTTLQLEINRLVKENSDNIRLYKEYTSLKRESQLVLQVTDFTKPLEKESQKKEATSHKLKLLFAFGEHSREFLPVESMMYLIKNITSGIHSKNKAAVNFSKNILSRIDLYIIGIANPDGRRYVEQTGNYCWRGTSTGVDLQRNFDWEFGGKGSSNNPKDEEYHGAEPFSEVESFVYTDLTQRNQFDAFFSFHSGINQIYVPYADTKSKETKRKPKNVANMLSLAAALSKSTRFTYSYGQSHVLNDYTADGTIFDYMAGVRKIPFSYTMELWGTQHSGPSCFDLFNPANDMLQEVVEDLHPLYVSIFTHLLNWKTSTNVDTESRRDPEVVIEPLSHDSGVTLISDEEPSLAFGHILLVCLIVLTVIMAVHSRIGASLCRGFQPRRRIVSLKALSSNFSKSI